MNPTKTLLTLLVCLLPLSVSAEQYVCNFYMSGSDTEIRDMVKFNRTDSGFSVEARDDNQQEANGAKPLRDYEWAVMENEEAISLTALNQGVDWIPQRYLKIILINKKTLTVRGFDIAYNDIAYWVRRGTCMVTD